MFKWLRRGRAKAEEHVRDYERLLRVEAELANLRQALEQLRDHFDEHRDSMRSMLANAVRRSKRNSEAEEAAPEGIVDPRANGVDGFATKEQLRAHFRMRGLMR